jgi:hypothetical protein
LQRARTAANPRIGCVKPADAVPTAARRSCARVHGSSAWSYGAWKAFRRFSNISGDVDLDSDAGVTVGLQLASILAWSLLGIEHPCDMRFEGSDNSHARKQHGSAIFGGIDEHLDGKPPFLTITL